MADDTSTVSQFKRLIAGGCPVTWRNIALDSYGSGDEFYGCDCYGRRMRVEVNTGYMWALR